MRSQQLTSVCVFITSCQIVSGQSGFSFLGLSYPQFWTGNRGLEALPQPPSGYHYEPMSYVLKNYPRDSYSIRFGASNISNRNNRNNRNNNGRKTGRKIKKKRSRKQNKDKDTQEDEMLDDLSKATGTPPKGPDDTSTTVPVA